MGAKREIKATWADPRSFFAVALPSMVEAKPCSLINFQFHWKEVGDTYDIPTLDETEQEIKRIIATVVPTGTVLAQPLLADYWAAIACDLETAMSVATMVIGKVTEDPLQTTNYPVRVSLAAGVASSKDRPSAAHLVHNALWLALEAAPHKTHKVASFRR